MIRTFGCRPRAGFTLLEAMVVVLVMGTLATIGSGTYKRAIDSVRAANHRAALASLTTTLESYAGEHESRVPKAPYMNKAFTAAEVGMEDYVTQGSMPSNPYSNSGEGHDNDKVVRGTFFYATAEQLTWLARPTGGVGAIETGTWPKLSDGAPVDGTFPPSSKMAEVPIMGEMDMKGAVIYESDGSSYVMYGLGAVVPRAGAGRYHSLTGVRTNVPERVQNQ